MPSKWSIPQCCYPEECSDTNFAHWRVESYESEQACRDAMLAHLTGSGLHWHHPKTESEILAEGAIVNEEEVSQASIDKYWAQVEKARTNAKAKADDARRNGKRGDGGVFALAGKAKRPRRESDEDSDTAADMATVARSAAEIAVATMLDAGAVDARPSDREGRRFVGAHPKSSRRSALPSRGADAIGTRRLALPSTGAAPIGAPAVDDDVVEVPRVILQRVIAHMERACDATRHGYQIADAARLAFGEETTRIEHCIDNVKQALRQAY